MTKRTIKIKTFEKFLKQYIWINHDIDTGDDVYSLREMPSDLFIMVWEAAQKAAKKGEK